MPETRKATKGETFYNTQEIGSHILLSISMIESLINEILSQYFCQNMQIQFDFDRFVLSRITFNEKIRLLRDVGLISSKFKDDKLFPLKQTRDLYAHGLFWAGLEGFNRITYKGQAIIEPTTFRKFMKDAIEVQEELEHIGNIELKKKLKQKKKEGKEMKKHYEKCKKYVIEKLKEDSET